MEGGVTSAQGTVGVCFGNQWKAVCDTYWTDEDAKVVCGQLGYTGNENGVIPTLIFIIITLRWQSLVWIRICFILLE